MEEVRNMASESGSMGLSPDLVTPLLWQLGEGPIYLLSVPKIPHM